MNSKGEAVERDHRDVVWLLAAGAVLHLLATVSACVAGRYGILPSLFTPAGTRGGDAGMYFEKILALGRDLPEMWARPERLHVHLYALSSATLAPLVGDNVLSLWPTSVAIYLLMLLLTYKLGRECFGARAGRNAAVVAGTLPSLLLHQTQPLHDPLFIVLMLTLLWLIVRLLGEPATLSRAAAYGAGGCATLLLIWLVRSNWFPLYVGIIGLGLAALCAATLREGGAWRARLPNFACLLLFLCALPVFNNTLSALLTLPGPVTAAQSAQMVEYNNRQLHAGLSGTVFKISITRQAGIIQYPDAGSNIDADRSIGGTGDVLAYLPRATLIGLFAPFPAIWFEDGAMVGRSGRLIAGAEMCLVYLLWFPALACVWRWRRDARVLFLLAVILLGAVGLGLVVVNVGALYRMRYVFWITLMILASGPTRQSGAEARAELFGTTMKIQRRG
ncbi:MAG: hypothetical protein ABW208_27570 [Pyrinomonadaceae bacterium]